jgi:elongation factor 1-gamma
MVLPSRWIHALQCECVSVFFCGCLTLPHIPFPTQLTRNLILHRCRYEKAKIDLGNALAVLDAHLLHRTYLVGEQISMADVAIVSTLVYPFKLVTDKNFLKNYNNVTRWFNTCVNQPEFTAVIGTVVMCKKELLAAGQAPPAAAPAADAKPKAAKKEKAPKDDAMDDDMPIVEKKAEHPYKIMDRDAPSAFSMDTWKKTYSNASSYAAAMTEFWNMFDSAGWTLWYQTYNYNEDNKKIFMTANAIGGFQQRTDEIRKWAFGVQDVRIYIVVGYSI